MPSKTYEKRDSSIELLRIIAVLFIISVHYLDAGGAGILTKPFSFSFNMMAARTIESFVIIGVNLFILITGYFGILNDGINIRRVLGLIILVSFWGLLLFFHALADGASFSMEGLGKALFPYMFGGAWYVRVYLILILLSPFLNVMIKSLTSKAFTIYAIITFILFSVLPSFFKAFKNSFGYDIIHFALLYGLGAYIRINARKLPSKAACLLAYFAFSIITTLFTIYGSGNNYWGYDFITCVLSSVALFAFFSQIHFNSRFINNVAKTVFGVYILNVSFPYLYTKFIIRENYFESKFFIVHFILSVLGFFIVASTLEFLRISLFSVTIDKLLNRIPFINQRCLSNISQ